jgi:UDP-3-O-[3-hydroxymyristoyl] N-acetylglucosamine deacetylase
MYSRINQTTVARPVSFTGIGVHSGKNVTVTIKPAQVNHGIKFVRTDLMDSPGIAARFNMVVDTSLATVIGHNGFIISTIEHLMACFTGQGIDNALVELDNYEMPIMDGSGGPFADFIKSAGVKTQAGARYFFVIKEPIELERDGKFVGIYPDSTYKITYTIDYDHPLIGRQTCTVDVHDGTFETQIAPARTFGFLEEYELMKHYGLAQGGSLDNVLVIDEDEVVNPGGLRYPDEFVRHKILDCIGDFSLLGMPILGHVIAKKSGHAFNHEFLKTFFEKKECWATEMIHGSETQHSPPKQLAI